MSGAPLVSFPSTSKRARARTYNREKKNLMYKHIFCMYYVGCGFCEKEVKYFRGMERRDSSMI